MKKLGKIILIIFGAIIILGVIGSMMDSEEEQVKNDVDKSVTSNVKANPADDKEEEKKEEEKPVETLYTVGDLVEVGNLSYNVLNVESTNEIASDNQFIESAKTNGQFIIIEIEAFNNDKETRMVDSNMFKMADDQGREFEPTSDIDVMMALDGAMDFFLQDINPGLSKTGKLVFELPADATSYSLEVSSGFGWSGGEYEVIKLK